MSLVISVNVREGVVMAADSRLTLNNQQQQGTQQITQLSVGLSDTNRKLFATPNRVGIGAFGQAEIQGVPIAGFIDSFIAGLSATHTPQQTAQDLLTHFRAMTPIPKTSFQVAGYNAASPALQEVWIVDVVNNTAQQGNQANQQGMAFGGEGDTISRLFQPVAVAGPNNTWQPLPQFPLPINFFTIQDAIDFVVYVMRTTIDTMRFQSRPKTVGGPIDVLVIQPNHLIWVNQKQLHMS